MQKVVALAVQAMLLGGCAAAPTSPRLAYNDAASATTASSATSGQMVSLATVVDAGIQVVLPTTKAADGSVCQTYIDGLSIIGTKTSVTTGRACGSDIQVDNLNVGDAGFVQLPRYVTADGRRCGRFLQAIENKPDGFQVITKETCDATVN